MDMGQNQDSLVGLPGRSSCYMMLHGQALGFDPPNNLFPRFEESPSLGKYHHPIHQNYNSLGLS